ncbi:MAG: lactonase family protein [Butyricicoccus pullicaecorum]|nr:lactonase family protein [Butyricicoccus pullicaecorum]
MPNYKIYVGTYAQDEHPGIFCYQLTDKSLQLELLFAQDGISNPSYLTASADGKYLYAVMEDMEFRGISGGGVCAFRIDGDALHYLNQLGTRGTLPCHILLDQAHHTIYTSNYMSGSLSMFSLDEDGSILSMTDFKQHTGYGPNRFRQEGPHVHFCGLSAEKDGIWCVDLGLDRLFFYKIDDGNMRIFHQPERDIILPGGVGPRHFVLPPEHANRMYIVCELSSEIFVVDFSKTENCFIQRISTLEQPNGQSTCAAIKCSPDGRFLYATNRGDDSIAGYAIDEETGLLTRIQVQKTGGRSPRDILVLDNMVLSANQDSDKITCFLRDKLTGKLIQMRSEASCPSPACLIAVNS